ncbi:VOC family protein [Longilinea arvoryzae]|uniref:VOC family protein n=1 Tax=Longilinea arvoryzae TaxID=360412 RepID=UPI000A64C447|nr:VOC family protein [Longilinea arvoryzae]
MFGIGDFQKEFERLKKVGVVFRQEPTRQDWGGYLALFEDTCGNLIQLAQQFA